MLDTHALLWATGKSSELSEKVKKEIENANNEIFVSAVSLWEISIKFSIGKLVIGSLDIVDIPKYCAEMGFQLIPITPQEAIESYVLKRKESHKDPFDRLLVYQCIKNGFILVSRDARMKEYKKDGLKCVW